MLDNKFGKQNLIDSPSRIALIPLPSNHSIYASGFASKTSILYSEDPEECPLLDRGSSGHVHCYEDDGDEVNNVVKRKLYFASCLCFFFMICEIIGGYLSNSLAIITDASHLFTDLIGFFISIISIYISSRPATKSMSFGWYRAEVLGALFSIILIWILTGILLYIAILRITTEEFDLDPKIMLGTSIIGVLVNIVMAFSLHSPHTHSHTENENNVAKIENLNLRAAMLHVIGDFFQSVGVMIAALIIFIKPTWQIVDPLCTFLFSIMVLLATFAIIKDALNVLMEGAPRGMDYHEVVEVLMDLEGVMKVHNVRIWSISLNKISLCAHLVIDDKKYSSMTVLTRAIQSLREKFRIFDLTLQIEEYNEILEGCKQCEQLD